jgi:hypothetical protein
MKLSEIKANPNNPRVIKDDKFKKLVKSIEEFPKMMALRPMVINSDNIILGGNMRFKALKELGYKDVPDEWVKRAEDLTDEETRRFIIADNVGFGEHDWDMLANEWDVEELNEWGLDIPDFDSQEEEKEKSQTEMLSELKYEPIYYEPKEKPNIKLSDCLDFTKYYKKIKALDDYEISEEQKEILKVFAYRFIKIDFESVANYYSFNATEEEQKAIERLRLVLTDSGLNGFIEDDLLKIMQQVIESEND